MNRQKLQRNIGHYVRLRPTALRFDGRRGAAQLASIDDQWIIGTAAVGVTISNTRVSHLVTLGDDDIHHYQSDVMVGERHGYLILTVQVNIAGNDAWTEPIVGPPPTTV